MATRFSAITQPAPAGRPHRASRLALWSLPAILGGALAVCAVSLLLYAVGTLAGWEGALLWSTPGARATPSSWPSLVWMVCTPLVAAAIGGAVAGRMRAQRTAVLQGAPATQGDRWHGLLAWVLGTALTALVMGVAGHSVVRAAQHAADSAAGRDVRATLGTATQTLATDLTRSVQDVGSAAQDVNDWALDLARNKGLTESQKQTLRARTEQAIAHTRAVAGSVKEVGSIFTRSVEQGTLRDSDARYIAQQITQRSDLTEAEAKQAVEQTFARMQQQVTTAQTQAQSVQQSAQADAQKAAGMVEQARATPWLWVVVVMVLAALVGMASARRSHRQRPPAPNATAAPSVP